MTGRVHAQAGTLPGAADKEKEAVRAWDALNALPRGPRFRPGCGHQAAAGGRLNGSRAYPMGLEQHPR